MVTMVTVHGYYMVTWLLHGNMVTMVTWLLWYYGDMVTMVTWLPAR